VPQGYERREGKKKSETREEMLGWALGEKLMLNPYRGESQSQKKEKKFCTVAQATAEGVKDAGKVEKSSGCEKNGHRDKKQKKNERVK